MRLEPQAESPHPELAGLSDARRRLLEKYLHGTPAEIPSSSRSITRRLPGNPARLSFAQERLWFLDQLLPGSSIFNVPLAIRLTTAIDEAVLEQSINEVVRRHEVLRTTYTTANGRPVPLVSPEQCVPLQVCDLSALPASQVEARARQVQNGEAARPFDLVNGPLLRAALIRLNPTNQILLITLHHICSDGWSLVLLFDELATVYEARVNGQQSPLPELPIHYADYAAWQSEWLQGGELERQLGYWKEKLAGPLPVLDLPTDRPRPAVQTYPGARISRALPVELSEALNAVSRREGATLYMTLLAAFKVLLHRYTGQDDIIVGSPIANRPQTETEKLIGFFLNNLALRTDMSGNPTFKELLARVRRTSLDAYAHQDLPFEKLIEELKPERDLSRTTIFQVYFNLFNFADQIRAPGSPDSGVSFFEAWSQSEENLSKFDLTLYAGSDKGQLHLAFVYNTDLFEQSTIERMLEHFSVLLDAIAANPELPISTCPLATDSAEPGNSIQPANAFTPFEESGIEQSITERFASQVVNYPKKTAIKTRKFEWSYEQLDQAANRVARAIQKRSRSDNDQGTAALLFEHDAPMIAGIFGVLKAGQAYVPLDPAYPVERLAELLKDSEAKVLVTNNQNQKLGKMLAGDGLQLINIDSLGETDASPVNVASDPHALAYLLYTSGSTGRPKGVMQNHRNVLHFIRAYTNRLHLNKDDRLTLLSSYCFDASVMDIFGALLNGATLYPIDIKEEGFGGLAGWIKRAALTVYHSTPTVYRHLLSELDNNDERFPQLRLVVLGGEQVNRADVDLFKQHFADDCLMVNGLGPTEATVSLQYFINKQTEISGQGVPVGYAVDRTEILLLDECARPAGLNGEIAIKCEHVALGYWRNRPATAAAFTTDAEENRIYRTGDLGRRLPDGAILFTGRKDSQVKVRGFRVELNEIEAALSRHPAVRETVVVLKRIESHEQLIAYVVPAQVRSDPGDLRAYLRSRLPEYMVPASFVILDKLPLTASGKLNRWALPAPQLPEVQSRTMPLPSHAAVETVLAALWAEVLGLKMVGLDDNFFELGGHSLLAVLLFARIFKYFGKRLPLATLFHAPTVAQLAAVIAQSASPTWSALVPIRPAGSQTPFFCVHAKGGNVLEYYDLARHLGNDQPFYGLQAQGLDQKYDPHTRVADMAAHYLKEIREVQPVGPYFLGGRSMGGTIAFEMACQLHAAGEQVSLLALLDTYPSGYQRLLPDADKLRSKTQRLQARIKCHCANIAGLGLRDKARYLAEKAQYGPIRTRTFFWRKTYHLFERLGRPLPRLLRDVKEFNSMAANEYVPRRYAGRVTLFWASEDRRASFDLVDGWRVLAEGGIDIHEISGSHLNLIKEPYVTELAQKLKACLERAQSASAESEPEMRQAS